jgi:serine phosphatase RsbU (regulator of sigma subunit)
MLYLSGTVGDQFKVWTLDAPVTGLGRSSKHTVQLVDATVSKDHAEIARAGDRWTIRDLGSRNGTRVNGVEAREPVALGAGDRIEIGHVPLRVTGDHPHEPTRLSDSKGISSSLQLGVKQVLDSRSTPSPEVAGKFMRVIAEAGRLLVLPRPLKETCDQILETIEKAVPASRLVLLLRAAPGAEPVQIAARHRGGAVRDPLSLSRAIMEKVLEQCTSVLITDAKIDPRFNAQQSIMAQSVHSALAVPLFDNEKVLGLIYADETRPTVSYGQEELELLTILANMAAVKITNARLLEAEQSRMRMEQELATATRIQNSLLPAAPPSIDGYRFHAHLETCYEVGGDLYDFHRRADGKVYFLVGDVSGKGMGAALLMSSMLASARVLYDQCAEPAELVRRLNDAMTRGTDPRDFITAFIGQLDPANATLTYVNAGHPPPAIVNAGVKTLLDSTGVPIGIVPAFPYQAATVDLAPGGTLILYSDGIPEAQNGDRFFDDQGLEGALIEAGGVADLEESGRGIMRRIEEFMADAPRGDDITLMMLRRD